jgi:hypothetical protein
MENENGYGFFWGWGVSNEDVRGRAQTDFLLI